MPRKTVINAPPIEVGDDIDLEEEAVRKPKRASRPRTKKLVPEVVAQEADGRIALVRYPPHETQGAPPIVTKTRLLTLEAFDGIVMDVLNKACPACGSSLWWSRAPRGKKRGWKPEQFKWHCAMGTPPPYSDAARAEIVRQKQVVYSAARRADDEARLASYRCQGCGRNPVWRGKRGACHRLCLACTVQKRPLLVAHCRACVRCRDEFFPGWRERSARRADSSPPVPI